MSKFFFQHLINQKNLKSEIQKFQSQFFTKFFKFSQFFIMNFTKLKEKMRVQYNIQMKQILQCIIDGPVVQWLAELTFMQTVCDSSLPLDRTFFIASCICQVLGFNHLFNFQLPAVACWSSKKSKYPFFKVFKFLSKNNIWSIHIIDHNFSAM